VPDDMPLVAREGSVPEGESAWLDRRFPALMTAGRRDEAYLLIKSHMGALSAQMRRRYGPELGGPPGIEALVHDTAWRAVESWASYRPARGGIAFWAFCIGRNLTRDLLREQCARREREKAAASGGVAPAENEVAMEVREAIDALPEPSRTLLRLDLEHGGCAGAKDLAAYFGVQVQTIYNWRRRAHHLLRERLQGMQ
jgi:DNA-directed RNA polymerase specialized sigma24 family protein